MVFSVPARCAIQHVNTLIKNNNFKKKKKLSFIDFVITMKSFEPLEKTYFLEPIINVVLFKYVWHGNGGKSDLYVIV